MMIPCIKRYEQYIAEKQKSKNITETNEGHDGSENYMFFANISNIKRMCEEMLEMDPSKVDSLLSDGHGWATDHIATSKDDVEEVYGFLKSSMDIKKGTNGLISDGENC